MNKDMMLKSVKKDIQNLAKAVATLNTLPEHVVDKAIRGHCSDTNCVFLTFPYDLELYREIRRALPDWKAGYVGNTERGERFTALRNNGNKLVIYLDPYSSEVTCEKILVDHKTIPVYKVRCR